MPSDDLACLQISSGKAYVKGFDIDKTNQTIIDIEKPRETEEVKNTTVPFEMGNLLRVNKVTGLAEVKKTIQYILNLKLQVHKLEKREYIHLI